MKTPLKYKLEVFPQSLNKTARIIIPYTPDEPSIEREFRQVMNDSNLQVLIGKHPTNPTWLLSFMEMDFGPKILVDIELTEDRKYIIPGTLVYNFLVPNLSEEDKDFYLNHVLVIALDLPVELFMELEDTPFIPKSDPNRIDNVLNQQYNEKPLTVSQDPNNRFVN